MNKVIILVLGYFVFGLLIESGETVHNTLKCYQCIIHGRNESLCDDTLETCPDTQAYDRCMVNIKRNRTTGEFIITKRCALAPCEFEKEVETALGFTEKCDLSRKDADCVKCCRGDGCNKRSSAIILKSNFSTFIFIIITLTIPIVFQIFLIITSL